MHINSTSSSTTTSSSSSDVIAMSSSSDEDGELDGELDGEDEDDELDGGSMCSYTVGESFLHTGQVSLRANQPDMHSLW